MRIDLSLVDGELGGVFLQLKLFFQHQLLVELLDEGHGERIAHYKRKHQPYADRLAVIADLIVERSQRLGVERNLRQAVLRQEIVADNQHYQNRCDLPVFTLDKKFWNAEQPYGEIVGIQTGDQQPCELRPVREPVVSGTQHDDHGHEYQTEYQVDQPVYLLFKKFHNGKVMKNT